MLLPELEEDLVGVWTQMDRISQIFKQSTHWVYVPDGSHYHRFCFPLSVSLPTYEFLPLLFQIPLFRHTLFDTYLPGSHTTQMHKHVLWQGVLFILVSLPGSSLYLLLYPCWYYLWFFIPLLPFIFWSSCLDRNGFPNLPLTRRVSYQARAQFTSGTFIPPLSIFRSLLLLLLFPILSLPSYHLYRSVAPLGSHLSDIRNLLQVTKSIYIEFSRVHVYPNRILFYTGLLFRGSVDLCVAVRQTHARRAWQSRKFQEFIGVSWIQVWNIYGEGEGGQRCRRWGEGVNLPRADFLNTTETSSMIS